MPNIKNKTLQLCQHLDLLKIPVKDTQSSLLNIYKKIINVYSSLSNIKVDYKLSKNINSESNVCIVIQILKYMVQNKMINTLDLHKNDCNTLQRLLLLNKHSELGKFINEHNRSVYKVVSDLIWNRKLPPYILNQLNKYDNLIYGYFTPLSIYNEIETNNLVQNIYQINYQTKTINVSTYTINNRKISNKKWKTIIKRIVLLSLLSCQVLPP